VLAEIVARLARDTQSSRQRRHRCDRFSLNPVADPGQGLLDGVEQYGFVDLPGVETRGAEVDGCPKLRGDLLRAGEVRSSGEHGIRRLGRLPREPPHGQVMA